MKSRRVLLILPEMAGVDEEMIVFYRMKSNKTLGENDNKILVGKEKNKNIYKNRR